MPMPKTKDKFTVQDYMTWPDEERWEIIDGIPYDMSPAPNTYHQTVCLNFGSVLKIALRGKTCKAFIAPTDVVLSDYDVVQPDVFVVCDPKKDTGRNIQGAPDLVVEILSPSTSTKDRREKYYLYEKYGVREYVVIDPDGKHAQRFFRGENGLFDRGEIFDAQQNLPLQSLEKLEIPLWEIFEVERKASE
jgi:Uma2 family endonuclease